MEFLRRHAALFVLGVIIAFGSYNLGLNSGTKNVSATITRVENATEEGLSDVDFAPFWRAWNLINEKYVPASTTAKTVDNQEKVWGAIGGLAESLGDPYTVFFENF